MSKVNRSSSASKTRNLETPKSSSTTAGQQKVGACINISNAVKAEIIWTLKIVDCGFSLWSSGNQSGFQTGRTKTINTCWCNWSIRCTYSFDESLNEVTEPSEMGRYVRFWNADSNQVQSRYFGSIFLGHTRHLDLLTHFRDLTKDLNPSKLYRISMDQTRI